MIEIPEWLARKLIAVLALELEETMDLLKLKECELVAIYEDEIKEQNSYIYKEMFKESDSE